MARILDYKSWQEYNKYNKTRSWHGWIKIDTVFKSDEDVEQAVTECYRLHQQRWDKVLKKLELTDPIDVPPKLISQLNEQLAGDLREVYGKKRNDAFDLNPPKRIDMVKTAEKLNIIPGDNGWEDVVLTAIKEDRI